MSRFGPRVLPIAAPGFVENLANAISTGYGSYQQSRARKQESDALAQQMARQEAVDASQGIFAPGANVPRGTPATYDAATQQEPEYGPPEPGSELASALGDMPPVASAPRGVVPGAFDARSGTFTRPRLPVQTLPGGYQFDPNVRNDAALAREMATMQERARMEALQRSGEMGERVRMLQALRQSPGYEGLTDAMIEAAATDDQLFRETVRPPRPTAPVRGSPEYLRAIEEEERVRNRVNPNRQRPTTPPADPIETKVQTEVAAFIRQGIEEEDPDTFAKRRRRPTDAEVQAYADQVRRSLKGEFRTESAATAADRWEQLVDGGMSPEAATAQVRREFPQ